MVPLLENCDAFKIIRGNFNVSLKEQSLMYMVECSKNVDERDKLFYGSGLDYRIKEFKVGSI